MQLASRQAPITSGHRRAAVRPCISVQHQRQCRLQASTSQLASTDPTRTSFHHGITYTSYEVNTAAVKFNGTGVRVLIDPWFVGDLVFGGADWLIRGKKRVVGRQVRVDLGQLEEETDVLLLTQGLDDHCHMPTLAALRNKSIQVVAAPAAAQRIKPLGFTNVTVLDHGQSVVVADGRLRVQATAGALTGPPWSKRQNGYVLREEVPAGERAASLYFESHCDFEASSVAGVGPVDIVVSPVVTSLLGAGPVAYALVPGGINLLELLQLLKPKVLLPLLNHEIDNEGLLSPAVFTSGSTDNIRQELQAAGLSTRVEFPAPPGEALAIAL